MSQIIADVTLRVRESSGDNREPFLIPEENGNRDFGRRRKLNPNDPSDANWLNLSDEDDANLEVYLNELVHQHVVPEPNAAWFIVFCMCCGRLFRR